MVYCVRVLGLGGGFLVLVFVYPVLGLDSSLFLFYLPLSPPLVAEESLLGYAPCRGPVEPACAFLFLIPDDE